MSVEDKEVIDFVSIDKEGNVHLTISDHLEWDIDNKHIIILQDKINSYLEAIETQVLYSKYPDAINRNIVISVVLKHSPNKDGLKFLEMVKEQLLGIGYEFRFKQLKV